MTTQNQPRGAAPDDDPRANPDRPGVLSLIGNTPIVPINRVNPNRNVELYAKLERTNPGGSVKDRIALFMIEEAERSGELTPGKTILEATSGNTGIGLAMVAVAKGYPILLAMSEGVSVERRKILAALGAEFLLTPADQGTDGAIERAYELAAQEPDKYYMPDQFNNPANVLAHYQTTAPEVWEQTNGRVTHLVVSMGTTGTLMGCSKRLRELNPAVRVIGVEPYLGHRIQGLKNLKEAYVPGIYDSKANDEKVNIEDDDAYKMARRLAREEGLLVGMSSGAAMHVACEIAAQIDSGVIVALLPDGGEKYLSTPLFQVAEPEVAPVKVHFFNTLSRRYEPFEPVSGGPKVTMYSCGPTVHRRPHLGVLRRLLVDDLVRRTLELAGYEIEHVVSITDFDDNTILESERTGKPMTELCAQYEAEFHEDLRALGIKPAQTLIHASESIDDMIALTRSLVEKGFAYEKNRSVYFNIGRVDTYGELSGTDLGKIKIGATVDLDRYDKEDPRDFTLLRRSTLGELRKGLSFKTDWGNIRPSWHVQCSAMARATLGERFDIHTASADLIFPHNENEIAQSRALIGEPQARLWLHSEFVLAGGKKMTYSEETCVVLPDLIKQGYSPREIRFFLLQSHYRQPVHLTEDRLEAARTSLQRLDDCLGNLAAVRTTGPKVPELEGWLFAMKEGVREALFDDMNISTALAAVFRVVRQTNYLLTHGRLHREDANEVKDALAVVDEVLGILPPHAAPEEIPHEIEDLLRQRGDARKDKDFTLADEIRDGLTSRGYVIDDLPGGTRIKRQN
ncbi:MAG: cysteine--tRNA ligase [Phycisphaerales bacterium]|nr:MAG: cysteine--tRNA ligase [Phycisphaerales bacterium]